MGWMIFPTGMCDALRPNLCFALSQGVTCVLCGSMVSALRKMKCKGREVCTLQKSDPYILDSPYHPGLHRNGMVASCRVRRGFQ